MRARIKKVLIIMIFLLLFSWTVTGIRGSEEEDREEAERRALQEVEETLKELSSTKAEEIADLLEEGKEYYVEGELEKAINIFRKILAKEPDNRAAYTYMLKAVQAFEREEERQVQKGKEEERRALAEQERIKTQKERLAKVHLERGDKCYTDQKSRLAIKEWEKVLSIQPENTDAQERILKVKHEIEVEEREAANEKKASELVEQGKTYFRQGQYDQAIVEWGKVLTLIPGNHPDYDRAESWIGVAEAYAVEKKGRDAIASRDISARSAIVGVTESWMRPKRKRAEVGEETLEGEEPVEAKTKLTEKALQIVSVHFENQHIRTVLTKLSELSNVNIVLDESVFPAEEEGVTTTSSAYLTIDLADLPLIEALKAILQVKNLVYRMEENLIWITTPQRMATERLVTKVYTLLRSITGTVVFEMPEIGDEIDEGALGEEGEQATAIVSAERVLDTLRDAVSWPSESVIKFDERTGTLVVRNTPTNLTVLDELIRQIEAPPMQVSIEARFISIGMNDLRQLGIEYPYLRVALGHKSTLDVDRDTGYGIRLPFLSGEFASGEGLNLSYTKLKETEFRMLLDLIESQGSTKVLSAPKVMTRNLQEATIKVVKEYRFPVSDSYEAFYYIYYDEDLARWRQGISIVPTSFEDMQEIGIMLTVTPDIGSDMNITLDIRPRVREFIGWITYVTMLPGGEAETEYIALPQVDRQDITTQIVVGDGETIVLGGLIDEEEDETITKVPFLGDIPIVGRLFKRTARVSEKRSLLIFITTHLVKPTGEWYRG